jgi:hypothetical protein
VGIFPSKIHIEDQPGAKAVNSSSSITEHDLNKCLSVLPTHLMYCRQLHRQLAYKESVSGSVKLSHLQEDQ